MDPKCNNSDQAVLSCAPGSAGQEAAASRWLLSLFSKHGEDRQTETNQIPVKKLLSEMSLNVRFCLSSSRIQYLTILKTTQWGAGEMSIPIL